MSRHFLALALALACNPDSEPEPEIVALGAACNPAEDVICDDGAVCMPLVVDSPAGYCAAECEKTADCAEGTCVHTGGHGTPMGCAIQNYWPEM